MPAYRKTGLLLMAYGSPNSLEDVEAYLLDVRGGRPPSPELVTEITERYRRIGGRSPLLERTREQAGALCTEMQRRFASRGHEFRTYVGMRHWEPRIATAVAEMKADGIEHGLALVMAPHSSSMSTIRYFAALDRALRDQDLRIDIQRVESWHDHPGLIEALAERARSGLSQFEDAEPFVIFTAHSLPERILEHGDSYADELNTTARLLAGRLSLPERRWLFCYQSAGASSGPWLGPPIEEVVADLARSGERNLLVVPIGFVCDHVEVLYDIDIEAQELAAHHGARLKRSPSLNASPVFIRALADLVEDQLSLVSGWKSSGLPGARTVRE